MDDCCEKKGLILSGFNFLNFFLVVSSFFSLKEVYYLEKLFFKKGFKIYYKMIKDSLNFLEKSDLCVLFGGFLNVCLNENE